MKDLLRQQLLAKQSDAELERKARKACQRRAKLWTQEELDWARRRADRLAAFFKAQDSAPPAAAGRQQR